MLYEMSEQKRSLSVGKSASWFEQLIANKVQAWKERRKRELEGERCGKWYNLTGTQAYLCKKCGYRPHERELCAVCNQPTGAIQYRAQLCMDHGYGAKSLNCCRCGRYCHSAKIVAHLCARCGGARGEDYCCKMCVKERTVKHSS